MTFKLRTQDGKHCIQLDYDERMYVFRYAYDDVAQATKVMNNLATNFGEPAGIDTDIATNYWRVMKSTKLSFIQRTTQKNNWYIENPQTVRDRQRNKY